MSGPLVALVVHHGPDDQRAWSVAMVVAEDMHHVGDTALMSLDELVRRTRLGRTSVVAGVRLLRENGWLSYVAGGGRGVANRYQLRVAEKLSTCSETCRHATGLVEQALGKQVATRPVLDLNRSPRDVNRSPRDHSTIPVSTSVPVVEVDDPMPGVLVAAKTGGTDDLNDYAKTVLRDVPVEAYPRDRAGLARVLDDARDAGWTAERLRDDLAAEDHDYRRIRGGAVLVAVTRLAARPAPRPPWSPCGECVNGWIEDERTGVPVEKCACHPSYGTSPRPSQAKALATTNGTSSSNLERLAAVGASPQFDPFRKRRRSS